MTTREHTRAVTVGGVPIGGGNPIVIQSMTNTDTRNVSATVAQINRLAEAGCEIVRVAVPDDQTADCLKDICAGSPIPVVADIHFDYRLAVKAAKNGVAKLRINPGNIGSKERVREVAEACRAACIPIRIGVNGGSVRRELLEKYSNVDAMVESASVQLGQLEELGFRDVCLSLKSADVRETIEAYRLIRLKTDIPLHVGVTHPGLAYHGIIKSSIGIGSLLCDGIGDTLRVSLTADPVEEVRAGIAILRACGLRKGPNLIVCPTCGRCRVDVGSLAQKVEDKLSVLDKNITVAVMGCAVNGPGEARQADVGVAGGEGCYLIFSKGEIMRKVPEEQVLDSLMEIISNIS